jgi:uncharacterized membrane protein YfcA
MNYVLVGVLGLVTGVVSGMFGIGGGVIIVPALVLLLRLDQHVAIGTSLGALLLWGCWPCSSTIAVVRSISSRSPARRVVGAPASGRSSRESVV